MSSLGVHLLETFVTLIAVLALAFLVLYGARKWGLGRSAGPLELMGRLPIDARRAVYLVRVGKLVYVVGASEAGLTKLGELGADALSTEPGENAAGGIPFREVLSRTKSGISTAGGGEEADRG